MLARLPLAFKWAIFEVWKKDEADVEKNSGWSRLKDIDEKPLEQSKVHCFIIKGGEKLHLTRKC